MSDVEETIVVPKRASEAMTKAATALAMQSCLTGSYSWNDYMSDLWAVMVANAPAAPKPDTSPVCVEIDWERLGNVSCDWNFPFAIFDPSCRDALSADIMSVVNARSVADVRAEYLKELIAGAKAEYAAACKAMDGARMVSAYAHYSALRALTEGEG